MNWNDVLVRKGVTVHHGTRYGGEAQRNTYDKHRNEIRSSAKKFPNMNERPYRRHPDKIKAAIEARKKINASPPIDVNAIQWVVKSGNPHRIINCSSLVGIVKGLMSDRPSLYNPLYRILVKSLQTSDLPAITRFYITATGVDPFRKKELGTFIKVMVPELGQNFALPNSFLEDCQAAFL